MLQTFINLFPDVANEHGLIGCALFLACVVSACVLFACIVRAFWTARFERAGYAPQRRASATRAVGIR